MIQRLRNRITVSEKEGGFTLIELLVVIIIIAVLAAIAIPVFLNLRQKGYMAQTQSALKNAATAVEAYATENGGDYSGLETAPDLAATLRDNGFIVPSWAIEAISLVPDGARPSYAQGYYQRDNAFYTAWDRIARDRERFPDFEDYLRMSMRRDAATEMAIA